MLIIDISIHALREERDMSRILQAAKGYAISIHALREERDPDPATGASGAAYFNPRAPRGARRHDDQPGQSARGFQSTRSARSATQRVAAGNIGYSISIHALREERDRFGCFPCQILDIISIHALREERDEAVASPQNAEPDFNPRAPRGARPACKVAEWRYIIISIHALREERD